MLNFLKVHATDSTAKARLKLLVLVPIAILSLPLIGIESIVRAAPEYYRDMKDAWNHEPIDLAELAEFEKFAAALERLVGGR